MIVCTSQEVNPMATPFQVALQPTIVEAIEMFDIPGFAIIAARSGHPVEHFVVGTDAAGTPLNEDSIFPIASIGKLAVALAVLRLADAGQVALDDPLTHHLPDAAAAQAGVTLRTLLSHTSGLPFNYAEETTPYTAELNWPTIVQACLHTALETPPGLRVAYSEVDYILLAVIVERLTGQGFGTALNALVLEPLACEAYLGVEPPRAPVRITGVPAHKSSGTPLEAYNTAFHRALANPSDSMLATADGTLRLVRAFQGWPAGFLRAETLAEATRNLVGDLGGGIIGFLEWPHCPWGLGPELYGAKTPHWAPAAAGADSFGHAGGSGCITWVAPSDGSAWSIHGTRHFLTWLVQRGASIGAAIMAALRQ
jgi:CubicO group peptidase (beta-lactamase class C family)